MKVVFRYGRSKADEKKKVQPIYIRVYHSRFDYRANTFYEVDQKEWKENYLIDYNNYGSRTNEEYDYLVELDSNLKKIQDTFKKEFRSLKLKGRIPDSFDWKGWCKLTLSKAKGEESVNFENPDKMKVVDLMWRYIDIKEHSGDLAKSTLRTWKTRARVLEQYEKDLKKSVLVEDVNRYFSADFKKWILSKGNSESYHGDFNKKIKSMFKYYAEEYPDSFNYHRDVDSSRLFPVKRPENDGVIITPEEWEKIYAFDGSPELNNVRDLMIVQYHACFRISDLNHQLRKLENGGSLDITKEETEEGETAYYWKTLDVKNTTKKKENVFKEFKVHDRILDMYRSGNFPKRIPDDQEYRKGIIEIMELLGIDKSPRSHDLRKSFCTNHYRMRGVTIQMIMEYSGHQSENSFRTYINLKPRTMQNNIPTS